MVLRDDYDDNVGFPLADSIFPNVELLDAVTTGINKSNCMTGAVRIEANLPWTFSVLKLFDIKNLIDVENEGQ